MQISDLLAQMGDIQQMAGQLGVSPQQAQAGNGNDVLGQIFGSKDVSRTVASHAAASSGLDASVLKKMLPLLATLAAGYMAKQHGDAQAGSSGGLGGLLGGLMGGGQRR